MLLLVDKTQARFYVNIVVFNTSLYTRIIGYKGILRQRFFISDNQGIAGCMLKMIHSPITFRYSYLQFSGISILLDVLKMVLKVLIDFMTWSIQYPSTIRVYVSLSMRCHMIKSEH